MKQLLLMIAVVGLVGCGKKQKETSQKSEPPKAIPEKLIINPIVEKEIRRQLKKPTGELNRADLEKVTKLSLNVTQITDEGLNEVIKLPKLRGLALWDIKTSR